jgi:methyltransferase (TIGR00027 family)
LKENQPSGTAERVAMRRAAHQLLDDPKVFDDPLALRIIGQEGTAILQADPLKHESSRLSPYLRASLAARSRYAEEELTDGLQRGVRQYVILGAGLDTFAYRNPHLEGVLQVFEIDHPATQAWKRARLEEVGIALPANLTFAPVDFERQTLEEGLREAGFDPGQCTFFSWLGVTPYLTTEGVMATLRFIASMPAGSGVVFDYLLSPSLLAPRQMSSFEALSQRVASMGEPWQAFFEPELLIKELRALGFGYVEDLGPEEINTKYFQDRQDGLRVGGLTHLMKVRV